MAKASKEGIRVGVIGYGGSFDMGKVHLSEMRQAGMIPTAVCDLDAGRLEAAERDFPGIRTFSSVRKMLESSTVDLVTVITPHNTHAGLALQCLNAGIHVVVEKPMAITTRECDSMIAAAQENRVVLSTYHNRHWDGCILQAVRTIRSGAIGDVVRVEAHLGSWGQPANWWRSSKSVSGGIFYDWGVHLLEYTLQIVDSQIVEVSGCTTSGIWASRTAWKKDTNEDEGFILVRYANGAWSSLLMTTIDTNPRPGWVDVTGTKGSYSFDHGTWSLSVPRAKGAIVVTKGRNPKSEGWRFYRNLVAHLDHKEKLIIDAGWARRPIHIIDLAYRSARKGKALRAVYG